MAWEKSKEFLEKVQLSSIVLYLVCLGGYAIPIDSLHEVYDSFRADIFGFAFFSLFIASTVLLTFEKDESSEEAARE